MAPSTNGRLVTPAPTTASFPDGAERWFTSRFSRTDVTLLLLRASLLPCWNRVQGSEGGAEKGHTAEIIPGGLAHRSTPFLPLPFSYSQAT
ncbi:hypothetical protein E2C01_057993 [Portunus trituberculatus]|uniref:Uncharacterized protein n=1 Tax=Portunus trituberculatus TaxID=210409 RepID=A0A5B7H201_PORTR|nr:hypothetical protein [Portunus trituberculatus]